MKAMMLTAGLGTRLRPVTDHWAKPAVPFLGIPLLKYPLYLMQECGVTELVLNTHYKAEQVDALAKEIASAELKVHVSHEPGAPLGSGGGIWKAKQWLKDADFLVCNGDEVILPRQKDILAKFQAEHAKQKALATILVMRHPLVGTQFGGVWCDSQGNVRGFGRDAKAFGTDAQGFHYIGMLLLSPKVFDYLPDGESNILYDALAKAIANKETVRIVEGDFTWFETGNPHDLLEATREGLDLYDHGKGEDASALRAITKRFWKSGTSIKRTPTGAMTLLGPGSSIADGVSIEGFAVLEAGAKLGSSANVENVIAMPNATINEKRKNEIVLPS